MSDTSNLVAQPPPEPGTALLVIDMMSTWRFPDGGTLRRAALAITPAIARLKGRCKAAGMPVIYVNDNQGQWRSNWSDILERVLAEGGDAARILGLIAPDEDDYFVLKPRHSAFFGTPLQLLLKHLGVRRLILSGVSSDQCVLVTAITAHMHDYDVAVPRDAVATLTTARAKAALLHFESVLNMRTTPVSRLRLNVP